MSFNVYLISFTLLFISYPYSFVNPFVLISFINLCAKSYVKFFVLLLIVSTIVFILESALYVYVYEPFELSFVFNLLNLSYVYANT